MQLDFDRPDYEFVLRAADGTSALVNDLALGSSFVIAPDQLLQDWPASDAKSLTPADLEPVLALQPEVVLLGTGSRQAFPPASVMAACLSRGIGIEVIQIGGNTCGKPYGFYPRDNCGTTYFSVQFRGVNEMNFGDYAEGFSATRITGHPLANLPGCAAEDDFTRDLGDPLEGQLKTALTYLTTGSCPAIAMASGGAQKRARPQALLSPVDAPVLQRPLRPWKDNRILR